MTLIIDNLFRHENQQDLLELYLRHENISDADWPNLLSVIICARGNRRKN